MEPNKSTKTSEESSPPVYWEAPTSNVLKLKYVAIGAFILILGFAGGMYYSLRLSETPVPQCITTTPTPSQTISPTTMISPQVISPTEKSDETSTWKTYENSEYKFKFKYPANWISGKKDGTVETTLSNQENTHKINLLVAMITGFGYCYNYSDEEEINVVDIPSKTANGTGPSDMCSDKEKINGTGNTYVLIPLPTDSSPGKKIYFDYTYPINEISKAKINLDQILSTFEFINK